MKFLAYPLIAVVLMISPAVASTDDSVSLLITGSSGAVVYPAINVAEPQYYVAQDHVGMMPAVALTFGAVFCLVGLGLIATGAHLLGIPLFLVGLALFILPYWLHAAHG